MSEDNLSVNFGIKDKDKTETKIDDITKSTEELADSLGQINVDAEQYIALDDVESNVEVGEKQVIQPQIDIEQGDMERPSQENVPQRSYELINFDIPTQTPQVDEEDNVVVNVDEADDVENQALNQNNQDSQDDIPQDISVDTNMDVGDQSITSPTLNVSFNEEERQRQLDGDRQKSSMLDSEQGQSVRVRGDIQDVNIDMPEIDDENIIRDIIPEVINDKTYEFDIRGLDPDSSEYIEARNMMITQFDAEDLKQPQGVEEFTRFLQTQFPDDFDEENNIVIPDIELKENVGIDAVMEDVNVPQELKDEFIDRVETSGFNRNVVDKSVYVNQRGEISFNKAPRGTAQREYIKGFRNTLTDKFMFDFLNEQARPNNIQYDDTINLEDDINNLIMKFNSTTTENIETPQDVSIDNIEQNIQDNTEEEEEEEEYMEEDVSFEGEVNAMKESSLKISSSSIKDFILDKKVMDTGEL